MDKVTEQPGNKNDQSTMNAPSTQKRRKIYQMQGRYARDARVKARGLAAIDRRSAEGREALAWRDAAIKAKGSASCPYLVKVEINLACFNLWRALRLQSWIIDDANKRRSIINRRRRELPRVHEQYDLVEGRFLRCIELLQLDKEPVMDLARRLQQQARRAQETAGR